MALTKVRAGGYDFDTGLGTRLDAVDMASDNYRYASTAKVYYWCS